MTLTIVLLIIFLGLLLVFLEIFLIPGTTLFGVIGGLSLLAGVVMMYAYYGNLWGNIALATSLILVVIAVLLGFRVIQSNRLAMKATVAGRVNEIDAIQLRVTDKGETVTDLRPGGKAIFNGHKTDVYSSGEFISRNTSVEIIKITSDKIFVSPLKS